ncbi:MAG TPA: hypothetical protein VHS31_09040 [Tepidisphaeraceae bacterium]|jgi:hypothetical protein|nr:hypothetical protein [Tepidisphaeraceae bacterium]
MTVTLTFPKSDTGLLRWSQNVIDFITPTPANWGLVTLDVTTYTALHNLYSGALTACDPSIRNKPAVITKNQARDALKAGATTLANKIYAAPAVTDAMKTEIGMPPRATPAPIPAPTTSPTIRIISTTGWTVRIRLLDGEAGKRGRPAGTLGAAVFSAVGETAPPNIEDWTFQGNAGRVTAIDVPFPTSLAAGTKVWFTAFWFNGRKQSGPASPFISANLPGGSVSMSA